MRPRVVSICILCWLWAPLSTSAQEEWKYYSNKVTGASYLVDDGADIFTVAARAICTIPDVLYLYFPVRYASIFPVNDDVRHNLEISFDREPSKEVTARIYDIKETVELVLYYDNIANRLSQWKRLVFRVEELLNIGASFPKVFFDLQNYKDEWDKCPTR